MQTKVVLLSLDKKSIVFTSVAGAVVTYYVIKCKFRGSVVK